MTFWIAGAAVVSGVGGAVIGSKATKKAANAAGKASDQAIAEQQRQFDLVRSDTAGTRHIGEGATNLLSRLYGYGPAPAAQAGGYGSGSSFSTSLPQAKVLGGSLNPGGQLTAKLGGVARIFDPAASIFGSKHGDERRNLKAFLADNEVRDLGDGMLALPDGRTFSKADLQHVAGTYYGARYAPDGDQQGWQAKYDAALTAAPQPAASATPAAPAGPDLSAFFESPDYQFRLAEGAKGIERSAAARGGLLSGAAGKALTRYNSNVASGEFGSFVDRLMQQAGLGNTGIGASAAAGATAASNIGNAYMNAGNTRANAYIQNGMNINNQLQGTASNLLLQKYLGTQPVRA